LVARGPAELPAELNIPDSDSDASDSDSGEGEAVTGATIAIWLALCQHYSIVLKWVYFVFHFRSLNSS